MHSMRKATLAMAAALALSAPCVASAGEPGIHAGITQEVDGVLAELADEARAEAEAEPMEAHEARPAVWISEGDGEMLKRIAEAEAGNQSVEGKALVMLVVLNRVGDPRFPDTVGDVITQTVGGHWQFETAMPGGWFWTLEPDIGCMDALELVRSGWDGSRGALYFESCDGQCWQSENCEWLFRLGGHDFYK